MKNILSAYQHSLRSGEYTGRTLEGLDRKKYTVSGVERLKDNWKSQLKNTFQIIEKISQSIQLKKMEQWMKVKYWMKKN